MPIEAEFLLIALALYLWESALWLPLRGIALRRTWRGNSWTPLDPAALIALRDSGLILMRPLPPDGGLAPCQSPPLLADDRGNIGLAIGSEEFRMLGPLDWADIAVEPRHLAVKGHRIPISSPRAIAHLSAGRARGLSPALAIQRAWRLTLSPPRAAREWRKWRLVSGNLRLLTPSLALGFFLGIPLAYTFGTTPQTLALILCLWLLMAAIACNLWSLGNRAYPSARAALRMDAALALLIPFHAMRANSIAASHALATTHPAALILATGDLKNPWLAAFIRRLHHPRPKLPGDAAFTATIRPLLARHLPRETQPAFQADPDATSYCPRCHSLYLPGPTTCPDCHQLPLITVPHPTTPWTAGSLPQLPESSGQ